jgi:hypothetical protein
MHSEKKKKGRSPFSTIKLLSSLILAIEPQNQKCLATQLLKPFIFGHLMVLVGGFADVDATWQWDPPVSILSLISLFSLSSFSSLLYRQPATIPMIAVVARSIPAQIRHLGGLLSPSRDRICWWRWRDGFQAMRVWAVEPAAWGIDRRAARQMSGGVPLPQARAAGEHRAVMREPQDGSDNIPSRAQAAPSPSLFLSHSGFPTRTDLVVMLSFSGIESRRIEPVGSEAAQQRQNSSRVGAPSAAGEQLEGGSISGKAARW